MANFCWTSPGATRIVSSAPHTGSGLGRWLRAALRALQYSRLVSALNGLPDTYLDQAGLRRCDILEHARRLVYGND